MSILHVRSPIVVTHRILFLRRRQGVSTEQKFELRKVRVKQLLNKNRKMKEKMNDGCQLQRGCFSFYNMNIKY